MDQDIRLPFETVINEVDYSGKVGRYCVVIFLGAQHVMPVDVIQRIHLTLHLRLSFFFLGHDSQHRSYLILTNIFDI